MKPIFLALSLTISSPALAQGATCIIPKNLPRPQVETPPPGEARNVPITGSILALSWSPQFCREKQGDPRHNGQCQIKGQFGFILHGLWPDGPGRNDPAWCAPAKPLPPALIARNFCMTPSAQLQQHEWQKHGTCATRDPERYFKAASLLFGAIKWPDMNALSYDRPTVAVFIKAFVAANPGLPFNAVRVDTTRGGWLNQVKICLDTNYRARACPGDMRGAGLRNRIKIWRDDQPKLASVIR